MKTTGVMVSCIFLTLLMLVFLAEVRQELNGADQQRQLTEFWKKRVAIEQLNKVIMQAQFADFKQEVASLIPDAKPLQDYPEHDQRLRDLASVIPHEKLKINIGVRANDLIAEGKDAVIKREYEKGVRILKDLIDKYPESHHNVEAHYLIMEAYFNMHQLDKVVDWVDKMIEVFPENRLTGYALLKLGGVYERQSRHEDALQIYRTIISSFEDQNLIATANKNAKLLEL